MNELEILAKELLAICQEKNWRICCAESCTGGLISGFLTEIAGASAIFERGFITYSNQAKIEMLEVLPKTLENFGAVSKETALEMVLGAQKNAKTEIAIATTGIAGPSGGSEKKPIGTVFIGLAILQKNWVIKENFGEIAAEIAKNSENSAIIRQIIRELTIKSAFKNLLVKMKEF